MTNESTIFDVEEESNDDTNSNIQIEFDGQSNQQSNIAPPPVLFDHADAEINDNMNFVMENTSINTFNNQSDKMTNNDEPRIYTNERVGGSGTSEVNMKERISEAIQAVISYNCQLQREKKTQRASYFDLQTMRIHRPLNASWKTFNQIEWERTAHTVAKQLASSHSTAGTPLSPSTIVSSEQSTNIANTPQTDKENVSL